jgi:hypothetical protein
MATMTVVFGTDFPVEFDLDNHAIADLWFERMQIRNRWPMDDDRRFYGFGTTEQECAIAEKKLRDCIETINSYQTIIEREWTSIYDQDLLNYLHSIFERFHGLLDQQHNDWWSKAPESVRKALADLNISVHRAEHASRGGQPRVVCTWFGMPKDKELEPHLMSKYGRTVYEFGGVYLNYVEIGKTLEDLTKDNDHYISDDAFQPFLRYSADFNIRFYDEMADIANMYRYYEKHKEFFLSKNIPRFDHYRVMPYRYRVARIKDSLDRTSLIAAIASRQHITDIYFS